MLGERWKQVWYDVKEEVAATHRHIHTGLSFHVADMLLRAKTHVVMLPAKTNVVMLRAKTHVMMIPARTHVRHQHNTLPLATTQTQTKTNTQHSVCRSLSV